MKPLVSVISAATLAALSTAVFAWGWGPWGSGSNDGWGLGDSDGDDGARFGGTGIGYGYPSYHGYAPCGYGVPAAPVPELTDEQKQAIAEQQARAAEYFKTIQEQVAEFHASNPNPVFEMQRALFEERDAHFREMNEFMRDMKEDMDRNVRESMQYRPYNLEQPVYPDREARRQEMQARFAQSRKAAEERFEALRKDHADRMNGLNRNRPGV
jgi:hypothetical protein